MPAKIHSVPNTKEEADASLEKLRREGFPGQWYVEKIPSIEVPDFIRLLLFDKDAYHFGVAIQNEESIVDRLQSICKYDEELIKRFYEFMRELYELGYENGQRDVRTTRSNMRTRHDTTD